MIRQAVCYLLAALFAAAPAQPQDTVIRVNVRLVRMLVTVKDANGQLVGSLNKNDFTPPATPKDWNVVRVPRAEAMPPRAEVPPRIVRPTQ